MIELIGTETCKEVLGVVDFKLLLPTLLDLVFRCLKVTGEEEVNCALLKSCFWMISFALQRDDSFLVVLCQVHFFRPILVQGLVECSSESLRELLCAKLEHLIQTTFKKLVSNLFYFTYSFFFSGKNRSAPLQQLFLNLCIEILPQIKHDSSLCTEFFQLFCTVLSLQINESLSKQLFEEISRLLMQHPQLEVYFFVPSSD